MNKRFISGMAAVALIFAGSQALPESAFAGEDIVAGAVTVDSGTCGDPNVNEGKNVTWTLDSEGTLTISGTGKMRNYDWVYDGDEEIDHVNVPWYGNLLKKVVICEGVTSIGDKAFSFFGAINSVTISSSVTSIGEYAFGECRSLSSITIPDNVTSIGKGAFRYCSCLSSITIPNGVTSIAEDAFRWCTSLTSITIPNSVTSIGDYAFLCCDSLASIAIPSSVTSIGGSAFEGCSSLASVTLPNGVTSIGENAFCWCISLTSITIPNSVTSIGVGAFLSCESLTSITIPNSVNSIDRETFSNCRNLKNITIRDGVTSIGIHAFYWCDSLESVTIPDSVTRVDEEAFFGCIKLTSITIPKSVTSIGDRAFGYYEDDGYKKLDGFKIYCYKDTAGHKYAVDNGFDYKLIDPDIVISPKVNTELGEKAPDLTKLTVTVFNAMGGIAAEVNADKDGNINFGDLPDGKYTLKIQLAGFAPRSMEYTAGTPLGEVTLCKYGDCNGDGSIDFFDLGLMQQKLCDWDVDYVYPETADTSGDSEYDFSDLGTLQRYLCDWGITLGGES